ncbi:GSCOCG00013581001-RA-CDS [Cotesia congregata]|uniref:Uncharacterized protein n=1 Tax=Cotesia congregata TaxID=51543 RepID=A0A8J2ECF7_COTCN|nr:GSCOCG00013581001-RA-CDS [Cotesia congregata]CAG5074324.1 Protein of unknown function [Cotesia congregata]
MKLIRLQGCCCLDLRSGTLCIGIVFLIGQMISVVQSVVRNNKLTCVGVPDPLACQRSSTMEVVFTLVGNLMFFVVTAIMLVGSTRDNHKLMVPYLVLRGTGIILLFATLWYIGVKYLLTLVGWGLTILIFGNAFICLEIYLWLVVNSRKLEIQYDDY